MSAGDAHASSAQVSPFATSRLTSSSASVPASLAASSMGFGKAWLARRLAPTSRLWGARSTAVSRPRNVAMRFGVG